MAINPPTNPHAYREPPISFSDIAPASQVRGVGPGERMDPYWSGLWATSDGGVSISWRSIRSVQRLNSMGFTSKRVRTNEQRHTQAEALAKLPLRRSRIELLGAINLWRTATTEQLAAITGRRGAISELSTDLSVLWDAGLVQRGRYHDGFQRLNSVPDLFRPDNRVKDQYLESLDYRDWIGVTGGSEAVYNHQFDRHNVLTTEIALRVAEFCAVRGVAGECVAGWSRLFEPSLEPNPYRAADAVIVKHDGSRILLETTVTVSNATDTKIKQLADIIARDPTGKTSVIFIVAAHPSQRAEEDVAFLARRAVARATTRSMQNVMSGVASRIGVVRWKDWFPSEGMVSPDFFSLSALTPTGPDNDLWQSTDFLSPLDGAFASEPRDGLNDLYGVPHWMRFRPTDFSSYLLKSIGLHAESLARGA